MSEFMAEAGMMMDSLRALELQRIDLNRADSSELIRLPGIGPVFAGRIVKYRELLGGYHRHQQLKEVYGLPEETVGLLQEKVFIDTAAVRKLDLQTATFRQLLRHPYLGYEEVRTIVRYRDLMGGISSINELIDNELITDSLWVKIAPYLCCGPLLKAGVEK